MNDNRIKAFHRGEVFFIKSIFLLIILLVNINLVQSQDIIYLNDGAEINSKVYEITPEFIKYKIFDELDGRLY